MSLTRRALVLWAMACAVACDPPAAAVGPVARAELGVFFGGPVQERAEIPFTLDRNRQTQGFRLTFHRALSRPGEIRWEVDPPGPEHRDRSCIERCGGKSMVVVEGAERPDQLTPEVEFANEPVGERDAQQSPTKVLHCGDAGERCHEVKATGGARWMTAPQAPVPAPSST